MGRPAGRKNKLKIAAGTEADQSITRHDNLAQAPLTDEQLEALTNNHARHYEEALSRKKTADALLKNVCKTAKAEGVLLADIKAYIDAKTEEGQEKLREQAGRVARVARWFKFAVQADLFGDDNPPSTNRSYRLGKEAGMAGQKAEVPTECDHETWMAGFHAGQAALAGGIRQLERVSDDPDF